MTEKQLEQGKMLLDGIINKKDLLLKVDESLKWFPDTDGHRMCRMNIEVDSNTSKGVNICTRKDVLPPEQSKEIIIGVLHKIKTSLEKEICICEKKLEGV